MRYLAWKIVFILVFGASSLFAQRFTAKIDKEQIKIGEACTITLELENPVGNNKMQFPQLRDTISEFIEIINIGNIDTTFDDEDVSIQYFEQEITVTSWDSGYYAIKPFQLLLNGDTLNSNPLLLEVKSVTISPEEDIKDIKDIMEVPFSFTDWVLANKLILLGVIALIVLLVIAYFLYKKYKASEEDQEIEVPKEKADIVALRKLEELGKKQLWQKGEIKGYYSELSYILREYIENRFLMMALELSTEEIIGNIQSLGLDEKENKTIHKILSLSDMAKFAKQKPLASENEEAFKFCLSFIESTKLIIEETIEEDLEKNNEEEVKE